MLFRHLIARGLTGVRLVTRIIPAECTVKDPQTGHQHHLADSAVRVRHRYTGQLEQHVLLIDDPAELGELRLVDPTLAPGWTATLAPGMDGWCGLEVTDPDDGLLYVGTVHLPVRFLCRPEVAVLELTSRPRPPRRGTGV